MDAGIRATGPVDRPARPIAEAGKRGFELSLDRPNARPLGLEPGEIGPVILQGQSKDAARLSR